MEVISKLLQVIKENTVLDSDGTPMNNRIAAIESYKVQDFAIFGIVETDRGTFRKFRVINNRTFFKKEFSKLGNLHTHG